MRVKIEMKCLVQQLPYNEATIYSVAQCCYAGFALAHYDLMVN